MPEITMPRLSDTMEEGTISRWLRQEGEQIHKGDAIAEIETDKAVMELEAYDEGPLTRVLVPEGTTVPIGTPVAVIGGEPAAAAPPSPPAEAAAPPSPPTEAAAAPPGHPAPPEPAAPAPAEAAPPKPPEPGARIPAPPPPPPAEAPAPAAPPVPEAATRVPTSPLARHLASEHGIDINTLTGSGPGGRVVRADVEEAIARLRGQPAPTPAPAAPTPAAQVPAVPPQEKPAAAPAYGRAGEEAEEVPINRVRRITAQRLTESARQAPHFYLTSVVNAEPLLAFRADINARLGDQGPRISVNDLIVKACATTLRDHPEVNASWGEENILRHRRVNIAIAVALDDGLTVPVVHDADLKPLTQLAREARALAGKARAGRLTLDELSGGTFSVSNLGPYGIDHFTAVINPPQAAILAVGAAHQEPVVRDGELTVGTVMALTLSIDHRVLDGATGAVFLGDLKELLENPLRIVV